MSDVTVIGLGNMGSALARTLLANGLAVSVWNRSPGKAQDLVAQGAVLAHSAAAAAAASPLILLCVTNYTAASGILGEIPGDHPGKVFIQLSTGSPQEARALEEWAHARAAGYLDGAITGSPASIGTPAAHIVCSGRKSAFDQAEPVLRVLAGHLDYKGELIGLASAWEMVYIMHYYGMFLSLFHSVQICQAEGIPLEEFIALLGQQGKNYEKWLCENILAGDYAKTSAPLELWAGGIQQIAQHARDSRIHAEFPELADRLFKEAVAAGYGREEVSALFKVMKKPHG